MNVDGFGRDCLISDAKSLSNPEVMFLGVAPYVKFAVVTVDTCNEAGGFEILPRQVEIHFISANDDRHKTPIK